MQKSHIIPNAFFRHIKKDENDPGKYIEISTIKNTFEQCSYSENLLCWECEQKFSNEFESYVITLILKNPININVSTAKQHNQITFKNIDFSKLKLFQMSVLWRAAISSLKFFEHVNLGAEQLELLRNHLMALKPLQPQQLPCFMERWLLDPLDETSTEELINSKCSIFKPRSTAINFLGLEYITFVFGGFAWRYWLSDFSNFYVNEGLIVNPNGTLICPIVTLPDNKFLLSAGVLALANEKKDKGIKKPD
ncbi:hypothetical protein [Shewanella xiamenensis]|uniref:hypothetical protein n=1 Tax=Shewanella xiamenensis TaxID=332186 RepID=UPI001C4FF54F|nr:hypothetical protein [Shewanella xiamenensis]MBW0280273.1 hypothetical protein [Shewanella xiamenensis]MCT8872950.1 hypothetical protein [Shewanella xiamenensis]UWH42979.1 hypothetical protein KXJ80_06900 [Shewanella xiamenensis]